MKIENLISHTRTELKFLETLRKSPFVKTETLKEIQAAIEEINLVKKGELKTRPMQELLVR